MKVTVVSGKSSSKRETEIDLPDNATVKDLKRKYAAVSKKSIHQISFKKENGDKVIRLDNDSKEISSYEGLGSPIVVNFKDLGPQIGYRTVFLVEYFGPMLFVALYYLRPAFLYGADAASKPYNWVAQAAIIAWMIHFLKREFETIFIHKFSRPTMPLFNIFKNCGYYWTFGAVIGYPLCSPGYVPPSENLVYIGLAIFALSELGNLIIHIMLSNMRPKEGSQDRNIPTGFLFDYVACPNYTFEILAWVGFSIMTQIPFAYLFTLVGFLQMRDWAMKKHKGYKKDFGDAYTKLRRRAIIPFLH